MCSGNFEVIKFFKFIFSLSLLRMTRFRLQSFLRWKKLSKEFYGALLMVSTHLCIKFKLPCSCNRLNHGKTQSLLCDCSALLCRFHTDAQWWSLIAIKPSVTIKLSYALKNSCEELDNFVVYMIVNSFKFLF